MTDHDLWRHLEAEFARVLGEVPKPEGPEKAKEAREE